MTREGKNRPHWWKCQLFRLKWREKNGDFGGDITRKRGNYFAVMQSRMQPFSGGKTVENRKIAVEKHDFSTLSTDFSTRVIHNTVYTF